jgi:DNA-binding MarR family transcriptional regulator
MGILLRINLAQFAMFASGVSKVTGATALYGALKPKGICLKRAIPRPMSTRSPPEQSASTKCSLMVVAKAQAIVLTRLKCLPLATLLKAAKHDAKVALGLYEALAQELIATHEHLLCVGQRGATERLAAFLLILSRRNEVRGSDPETIKLPMTRVDIADFLGLTIETVSRTFSKLKSQGLIEIDQNTTIHLKNTDELKRLAEGGARV